MRTPVVATSLVALLLALAGCGGSDGSAQSGAAGADDADTAAQTEVDEATQSCRDDWARLGEQVEQRLEDAAPTPSLLRTRWVTVEAQIAYYANSATGEDCEARLEGEQARIAALTGFSATLQRFDMERRLAGYEADDAVTSYARPSGREGRAAPTAREVRRALADLRRLAPRATAQQAAAWQQVAVVDLDDDQARQQAVADLRVVSGESAAYGDALAAARVLARAAGTGD